MSFIVSDIKLIFSNLLYITTPGETVAKIPGLSGGVIIDSAINYLFSNSSGESQTDKLL